MFAHVAADRARVGVVTAAGGETDDHPDGLVFVKVCLAKGLSAVEGKNPERVHKQKKKFLHGSVPLQHT